MRQAGVMRYLMVVTVLMLMAACGTVPGLRTSMPPVPAENPPGTVPPEQAPAPPADLAQQVQSLEGRVQQLERQVATLQGHPAPAKPHVVPAPSTSMYPRPTPKPAISNAQAEKDYTEGMRLYHAKKYAEARKDFYDYLKSQPKGARAPEARYYLADSYYLEGKYKEAAVEFNKLRLQFPKSILVPAGMLRQALCYKNQKRLTAYRDTLTKLVKAYPHSAEAREARKLLKEGGKMASR